MLFGKGQHHDVWLEDIWQVMPQWAAILFERGSCIVFEIAPGWVVATGAQISVCGAVDGLPW